MRILFLTPRSPYPPIDGDRVHNYNMIIRFAKNNEIILASFLENESERQNLVNLKKYCIDIHGVVGGRTNLSAIIRSLFSLSPFHVTAYKDKRMRIIIGNILKTERIDVIHCNYMFFAQYLPFKPPTKIIQVLDQHNVDRSVWKRVSKNHSNVFWKIFGLVNWLKTMRYERYSYKKFHLCLTLSQNDLNETKKFCPESTELFISKNGVDLEYFTPQHTNLIEKNTIVFCGGTSHMNLDALRYFYDEIFPLIKSSNPEIKFYVVGDIAKKTIPDLAQDKSIVITELVDDIRPYIGLGAVFVAPFRLGGGVKLKVLEAMAMGKAVVSTTIGCQGIDVEDRKNIIIADDPNQFARAVLEVLENHVFQKKLGKNARLLVETKYNWDLIVKNIENKYLELLSNQQSKPHAPLGHHEA